MDSIADGLHISKRTLYEIFRSKENMFVQAHEYYCRKTGAVMKEIFEKSSNVMEAILQCFLYNRDMMSDVSVEFIRDINEYVNSKNSEIHSQCDSKGKKHYPSLLDVLYKGVTEGFFRKDLNLQVQCRMFIIQMESLKRMEELFPQDITLLEVYDSIITGFLRAISTIKGLKELDRILPMLQSKK